MDILSNLTNLLGQGAAPKGGQGGSPLGSLGGLASLLGGGGSGGSGGGDPLGGLGSLVGSLMGGKGAAPAGKGGDAGLGGIGSLIGSLMGSDGGSMLSSLLGGGDTPPPAPKASEPTDMNRATNLIRALVYASKADGKIDKAEQAAVSQEVQKQGFGPEAQQMVNQFMSEDLDPANIARNITSSEEALQIYALSCAITQMDNFMERNYLNSLSQALGIPANVKQAIEAKIAS